MVLIFLTLTIQSPVSPTDIGGAEGSLFLVGVFPLLNKIIMPRPRSKIMVLVMVLEMSEVYFKGMYQAGAWTSGQ